MWTQLFSLFLLFASPLYAAPPLDDLTQLKSYFESIKKEIISSVHQMEEQRIEGEKRLDGKLKALNASLEIGFQKAVDQIRAHDISTQGELQNIIKKQDILEKTLEYMINMKCQKANRLNLIHVESDVYYFSSNSSNWKAAKKFCHENGMHLALLDTRLGLSVVHSADRSNDYWVGASDVGHQPGQFYWENGLKVDDFVWDKAWREPDNFGEGIEACVWLRADSGKLCDNLCIAERRFICELAEEDRHCLKIN